MTRRFEFHEGGTGKFWEIHVQDTSLTVAFGRIGTSGQRKTKSFDTASAAQKEADKLILEKRGNGYVETASPDPRAAEDLQCEIEQTITRILELKRSLSGLDKEINLPTAPASREVLARADKELGDRIPPDYRAFLTLHNGWSGFDGFLILFSATDLYEGPEFERVEEILSCCEDLDIPEGALFFCTTKYDDVLHYFDPSSRSPEGLMNVVEWQYEEMGRYSNFSAFLNFVRTRLEQQEGGRSNMRRGQLQADEAAFATALVKQKTEDVPEASAYLEEKGPSGDEPVSTPWKPLARNTELEGRVGPTEEDRKAHLAYAAWLSSVGDPRGKLIETSIAAGESKSRKFKAEARKLLEEYIRFRLVSHYPTLSARMHGQFRMDTHQPSPDRIPDFNSSAPYFRWGILRKMGLFQWPEALIPEGLRLLEDPECAMLQNLFIKDVSISDFSFMRGLPYLTNLNLSGTAIRDFRDLTCLKGLKILDLDDTTGHDLTPLAELAHLDALSLRKSSHVDLSGLRGSKTLRKLYLNKTNITNLAPLRDLTALEFVSLEDASALEDISPLMEVPRLCEVWLYRTSVSKEAADRLQLAIKNRTDVLPGPGISKMKIVYGP